jgi:regulator of protease activity HflC (stomatin/prohibitin superfamily)
VRPLLDLREQVVSFPPQPVITADNVSVGIDTVLYFTITEAKSVTYEVANPLQAIEQLTVTTLRNVIGGITLEQALTSRDNINTQLRVVLDEATGRWGIRINRVELKSIDPPGSIQEAMEKQMRAEREKRAVVLTSEGERDAKINAAEGDKQRVIKQSEANKQQQINEAEGQAQAILAVATATAEGLRQVGIALSDRGGIEAMQLRIGEEYVKQFGKLAQTGTTLVVPANLTDLASIVTMATSIARKAPATPAA